MGRHGDLAQAYMDLGAMICTPKSPKCGVCPISGQCLAHQHGIASKLPLKEAKKDKPKRQGCFYWITNGDGAILFERRDENRMLGGMLALPTTDWDLKSNKTEMQLKNLKKLSNHHVVYHSFTHFDLELQGYEAEFESQEPRYVWVSRDKISDLGLPSLFKKAVKIML
jgi:A/G-specific adenine glycosylase